MKDLISTVWLSSLERQFYDDHDRKIDGSTTTQSLSSCCVLTNKGKMKDLISTVWLSSLKRQFYDDHDRKIDGSTTTQSLSSCCVL